LKILTRLKKTASGFFFGESTKSSRANPLSAQEPRLKKAYGYDETASDMFFYGFRYYDPETGRWPNRDPLGERGGLNLYAMVGNEVLNAYDVLGRLKGVGA
jgi:RHS repeat-associated protein